MEKMLNDYLEFSKTQSQEETVKIDITKLLEKIELNINNKNLTIKKVDKIFINGRPNSLRDVLKMS